MAEILYCKTKYVDEDVVLSHNWYSNNGRLSIRLLNPEFYDDCVAKVTTNVPQIDLKDGEIIIRDDAEFKGTAQWMIDQGFISPYFRMVPISDWVTGFIFKVTDKLLLALSIDSTVDFTKIIER